MILIFSDSPSILEANYDYMCDSPELPKEGQALVKGGAYLSLILNLKQKVMCGLPVSQYTY